MKSQKALSIWTLVLPVAEEDNKKPEKESNKLKTVRNFKKTPRNSDSQKQKMLKKRSRKIKEIPYQFWNLYYTVKK